MNSGKAIRQKIRDAIKAKLVDLGSYVDEELPDYIMVMLANKRSEAQMTQDLDLFLNENSAVFTSWLFELLKKLEQKPGKTEKKKKKREKSSKHRSQKSDTSSSSSSHQVQADSGESFAKETKEMVSIVPQVQQQHRMSKVPGEGMAPIISILPDTNDTLDEALTKEIDADRRSKLSPSVTRPVISQRAKQPSAEVASSRSSYKQHVTQQRVSKSLTQLTEEPPVTSYGTVSTGNVAESSTHQQTSDVKLRLGERHVQEVLVSEAKKRPGPGSVVAKVIHNETEEDSGEEDPAAMKKVASSVRANRRPTLPRNLQANTSLLKRAVSEATASATVGPYNSGTSRRPNTKLIRPQITKPNVVRDVTRSVPSSTVSDDGIQSGSMKRELMERDFDSQTFQTVKSEDKTEGEIKVKNDKNWEEVAPVVGQEGVFVYKNVVAVVGRSKSVDQTQVRSAVEMKEEFEDTSLPPTQPEADSRQIYLAENVSIADSTQSPENSFDESREDYEGEDQIELLHEGYMLKEQNQKDVEKSSSDVGSSPTFIVTLEGAKRHVKPQQNKKIQRYALKRGLVRTSNTSDVIIKKQPRKTLSPEVKRQFIFAESSRPYDVVPTVDADTESDIALEEPTYRYTSIPMVEPLTISMEDSDEDGFATEDPQVETTTKSNERCRFWPACKNGDSCTFIHPTTPCRTFPNCKFGDKCLYIHPNCKFDSLCTKPSCPYTHATRQTTLLPHRGKPVMKPAQQAIHTVCKFHPACQNPQCAFLHPKPCRFGASCSRQGCHFFHSNVAGRSSFTWTKESSQVSKRQFAVKTSSIRLLPSSAAAARPVLSSGPRIIEHQSK